MFSMQSSRRGRGNANIPKPPQKVEQNKEQIPIKQPIKLENKKIEKLIEKPIEKPIQSNENVKELDNYFRNFVNQKEKTIKNVDKESISQKEEDEKYKKWVKTLE
mgnify:CR=1 FL=1